MLLRDPLNLTPLFRQPALCLDRGLATHACRSDRLPVMVIGAIACNIYARCLSPHLAMARRHKISLIVGIHRALEWRGVRFVADRDKHAFDGQYRLRAGL